MPDNFNFTVLFCLLSTFIFAAVIIAHDSPPRISINKSFAAEIEATFITEKYTMAIKEYFQAGVADLPERGSILQTVEGTDVRIVLEYSTNRLFIVADNKCRFKNISVYLPEVFIHPIDPLVKYPLITSKDAMRLIQDTKPEKVNDSIVIRGIETSRWRFPLKNDVSELTIESYFTNGWDSEGRTTKQNIPVRFDVFGQLKNKPFHVVFDYYFFEYRDVFSFDEEAAAFEMPTTIFCEGADARKKLPEGDEIYSYSVEIIDEQLDMVEVSKIWYHNGFRLLRRDFHPSSYPLDGYPVTEVYDLRTGVVYMIDNILQNCSMMSAEESQVNDITFNPNPSSNKDQNLQIRDPLALLRTDDSVVYLEQRKRRNIICDVFMLRRNYTFLGQVAKSVLFVYYFMSADLVLYPDFGGPHEKMTRIPIMVEMFAEDSSSPESNSEMTLLRTYNFIDYTTEVDPGAFSISQCYSRNTEIYFKIGFPGILHPSIYNSLRHKVHSLIADTAGIFPHRVQKLSLHSDSAMVYVRAAIIDRTKAEAQFSLIKNKQLTANNVKTTFNNFNLHSCASKCILLACQGFDLSNDGICRLATSKLTDASTQLTSSSTANYYTRTVVGTMVSEMTARAAWDKLTKSIYKGNFQMSIDNPRLNDTLEYTARMAELVFGVIDVESNPIFPSQMSYRAEFLLPSLQSVKVSNHAVWYDGERKLFRYDERFSKLKAPFYSLNPLTTINDFTEGVSYHIDQTLGNCTILPLADKPLDASEEKVDDTTILRLKNPDQLFRMDSKFKFYGQKTLRGILCDVYESVRTDFIVPGQERPTISIFRYCFVNVNWADRSDTGASEDVAYTPLQLEIISSLVNYYAIVNFFDYSNDIPPMDVFDIRRCFEDNEEYKFQVTFSGTDISSTKYDPTDFVQTAEREMARIANVNILRIQEAVLEYDSKFIYFSANLLTYPPAKAHFRKFSNKIINVKEDKSYPEVKSVDDCAAKCMAETGFTCKSFDFCPKASGGVVSCKLSKLYSPDGKKLNNAKVCDHYSRVVSSGNRLVRPLIAIGRLKDAVESGTFNVTLYPTPDEANTAQVYTAIKLRDDVTNTDSVQLTMENNIKKFDRFKNDTTIIKSEQMRHYSQMSVDDCANLCLIEPAEKCESFAFCFWQGDCYVATSHPDQKPEMLENHKGCSVYNRNYLYKYYKEPGLSSVTIGDKPVDVTSASDCAKQCTMNDDFLCQTFQYCSLINECTLSKVHKMDIPDKEIKGQVECDIYFRKYIDDFTISKGKRVALVNNQVFTDLSEEQCAKVCMEEESFNCASFDYCSNTTECRLTNHDTLHSGQVTIEKSAFCNHFRRKPTSYASHAKSQKGVVYSSVNLTAVALSTLFVSFLLGILTMTFYLRRKPTVSM